jgi:hypothetical protein
VQSLGNEFTAKLGRQFHPLRFQRWAFSDLNPWLAWLGPAAQWVRAQRQTAAAGNPAHRIEQLLAESVSASLDFYRELRDATSEALFFETYGSVFSLYLADRRLAEAARAADAGGAPALPFVEEALASIEEGGFAEALARVGALLARRGAPLPLARIALKQELAAEYRDLLPDVAPDAWRRIRGEQDIIVRYAPDRAIATLPKLLARRGDRERLVKLVRALLADQRTRRFAPTPEQLAMIETLGEKLDARSAAPAASRSAGKPRGRSPATKRAGTPRQGAKAPNPKGGKR